MPHQQHQFLWLPSLLLVLLLTQWHACWLADTFPASSSVNRNDANDGQQYTAFTQLARIVNGINATDGAWRFMVKLIITSKDNNTSLPPERRDLISLCGATVLDRFTLLTAAHCFPPLEQLVLVVPVIGSHQFMGGTKLKVANIVLHPDFCRTSYCNDVALVQLAAPVPGKFNATFTHLPPAVGAQLPELLREECVVLGWGREGETQANAQYLKLARVPLLSDYVCAEHSPAGDKFDAKSMMCAGYLDGTRDACMGDSGGPLLCPTAGRNTVWYQVGIISFGDGCARVGVPGYYSRVSQFVEWIHENKQRRNETTITQQSTNTTTSQPIKSTTQKLKS